MTTRRFDAAAAAELIAKEGGWWRRRITMVQAARVDGPFTVETPHGPVTGEEGDWVALDTQGNPYPIASGVFEETYSAGGDFGYHVHIPESLADKTPGEREKVVDEYLAGARRSILAVLERLAR